MSSEEGIKVYVRVRPPNEREKQINRSCVDVDTDKNAVIVTSRSDGRRQQFVYDKVADPSGSQSEVFETVGKPTSEYVLEGYNSTIFAYGQTGAGKTFTMQGVEDGACEDQSIRGLIPRVFEYLFSRIEDLKAQDIQVVCKCSYLEIYNEAVTDLLSDSAAPITIRDDPRRGVVIEGAKELPVSNANDTFKALTLGSQNRKVAATCMNKESSRSHSVFTLYVQLKTQKDGVTTRKFARFNLIDLAGSERQKNTNATGDRLKEANNINRSLSALGNVIMALANANGHVPYRDSKLTFMLKDSIGGNSKTCIIACISPAESCLEETLSTLKFVRFAKLVKNVATINQDSSGDVKAMQHEIERLKAALRAANAKNHADRRSFDDAQGDILESKSDGASHGSTPIETLLHQSLEREAEARALLSNEKIIIEEKMKLISAQEAFIGGAKMALRLKNGYIERLEKKMEIQWPEQEALLKVELEEVRKQLSVNPLLVRSNIRIAELTRQVEELEEIVEESGAAAKEGERKRLQDEIEQLSDALRMTIEGKNSAETRVEQLMEEMEDKNETIEHLQVVMSEFEHSTNAKGNELQSIVDENNDLRVQLIEAKEEAAHFNNECKQLNADLQESRVIASKLEETLAQKSAELELIRAQFSEFKKHAEGVVCDFESKSEASALVIESLESQIAASGIQIKEITDSAEFRVSALESEKDQLQKQLDDRINQEAGLHGDLQSKTQKLEEFQLRNLEAKAQNEALFSKIFEALNDFNLNFQTIVKEVGADIESYHSEQVLREAKISELQKSLEASESATSEAHERANLCMAEKEQIESQLHEAKEMLMVSEQGKSEAEARLRDLQADMSSAECKIEALLVSLDSSEKQKNESLQELKTLTMEKEGCAVKMTELASRVEQADDFKKRAEQTIQNLTVEHERTTQSLSELMALLDKANAEKADLENQLNSHQSRVNTSEQKVADLLAAFEIADKTRQDAEQNLNDLRSKMDSILLEKLGFEESKAASEGLIESFIELNYSSELNPSPEMSLIEKAAACKQILALIVGDLRKASDQDLTYSREVLQQNSALDELRRDLEAKVVSLESIREDLEGQHSDAVQKLESLQLEKRALESENERLLSCQSIIQEKLDHQLQLHQDHVKLQNSISELSEQIVAASEALQASEEARLSAESRNLKVDEQSAEVRRILDDQRKACADAEAKCAQLEAWLSAERQSIQDLLAVKSNFEARISQLQECLDEHQKLTAEASQLHDLEMEQLRRDMQLKVAEELAAVESVKAELSMTLAQSEETRDEQAKQIERLQNDMGSGQSQAQELSNLLHQLQQKLQDEINRIAELKSANTQLEHALEVMSEKWKGSETALEESTHSNSQLLDSIKIMQERLDSIEEEMAANSKMTETAHTTELSRMQTNLDEVTTKLSNVLSELDKCKADAENFKTENAALLERLYGEIDRQKQELNEAILAAAAIEKTKEGLEVLLAQSEKALQDSTQLNEECEAKIAGLKSALKQETAKLNEATAIRKQLEKHYLRQIEELLSNRPANAGQEELKAHGRRALSVLAGENTSDQVSSASPLFSGDRKTPIKARLRDRSKPSGAPGSAQLSEVSGSPAIPIDGGLDELVSQSLTRAKMQR